MLIGAAPRDRCRGRERNRDAASHPRPVHLGRPRPGRRRQRSPSRKVLELGQETGSTAVKADAWHHRSDALTSAAAFIGISIALWEDLAGSRPTTGPPSSRRASSPATASCSSAPPSGTSWTVCPTRLPHRPDRTAAQCHGRPRHREAQVRRLGRNRLLRRPARAGRADTPLRDAHILSGKVRSHSPHAFPQVAGVLVHMEPPEQDLDS